MSAQYLLDTDWMIHYLNGQRDVISRVDSLRDPGVALSVVSLAELYEGVYYSRDPQESERQLNQFVRGLSVLGVDVETGKLFGRERGRLRAAGKTVGDFDLLIASTALQHNLTLLSNNRRHFELIDRLQLELL